MLIDTEKSQCIGEINRLDNRREWINWITLHGEKIEQYFENWEENISHTTEMLSGMISSIKVSPVNVMNRDKVEKQVGHKLVINFKQPIVNDVIKYITDKKTNGYNIVKGKKRLDVGEMKILTGGRGKKHVNISNALNKNYDNAKKKHRI